MAGKVRYLEASYLWIQDNTAIRAMRLHTVRGPKHPADAFTKHVNGELIDRYCNLVNIEFADGGSSLAPEIDHTK